MSHALLPALAAGVATLVGLAPVRPFASRSVPAGPAPVGPAPVGPAPVDVGWLRRHRAWWSMLAALGVATFLGGAVGVAVAPAAGVAVWVVVSRAESPAVRRRRVAVRRDLPTLVTLLAAALRSGSSPAVALDDVCAALPGAAADRLASVVARLGLGDDPARAWADLAGDADLGPLGRTLARSHRTGSPVVEAVERLATELARSGRADIEDRARAVGVRAAVPLGLCLLPAFVLIGIVPLVAALLGSLAW